MSSSVLNSPSGLIWHGKLIHDEKMLWRVRYTYYDSKLGSVADENWELDIALSHPRDQAWQGTKRTSRTSLRRRSFSIYFGV
jgi:hypothetical protein